MVAQKKVEEKEYFDDPIIDDIKKNIIEDIDFFSYERPASVQTHVANNYTSNKSPKSENESTSECTDPKTK